MKRWALLLLLPAGAAQAQTAWPHNAQTDSIEFVGTLPWPASDTAASQRRALVERWYSAKMLDVKPTAPFKQSAPADRPLTRLSLSGSVHFKQQKGRCSYVLSCEVLLSPGTTGMTYRLSKFVWGWVEGERNAFWALESLPSLTSADRKMLVAFREQLHAAVATW